jgi:predicted amidophosphoribosyltransferase
MAPPPGLDTLTALLAYDELAGALITSAKYRNARPALVRLAHASAALAAGIDPPPVLVTWAPTTPARARARGFDQSRLVAAAVAGRCGLPCRRTLAREEGPHQTGRSALDRLHGVRFDAVGPVPGRVMVVDDVATTGATLSAAATVLRAAGARTVHGLVLARTPAKGGRR